MTRGFCSNCNTAHARGRTARRRETNHDKRLRDIGQTPHAGMSVTRSANKPRDGQNSHVSLRKPARFHVVIWIRHADQVGVTQNQGNLGTTAEPTRAVTSKVRKISAGLSEVHNTFSQVDGAIPQRLPNEYSEYVNTGKHE